jgi:hypothetical protein
MMCSKFSLAICPEVGKNIVANINLGDEIKSMMNQSSVAVVWRPDPLAVLSA